MTIKQKLSTINHTTILGIKINLVSMVEAVDLVSNWIKKKGKHYIVTPNPEFIMAARQDQEFWDILNQADLAIPDGVGLKLARTQIKEIIPGVDLMEQLCQLFQ